MFFKEMGNVDDNDQDTISICFDLNQNKPLPKTNIGECYYMRQLWLMSLGVMIVREKVQSKDEIFLYTWLETEAGKGSNEIASCLDHFLVTILNRLSNIKTIKVFSDNCPGQNKNRVLMLLFSSFAMGRNSSNTVVFSYQRSFFYENRPSFWKNGEGY